MLTKKQISTSIGIGLLFAISTVMAVVFWPAFTTFALAAFIANGFGATSIIIGLSAATAGISFGLFTGILASIVMNIYNQYYSDKPQYQKLGDLSNQEEPAPTYEPKTIGNTRTSSPEASAENTRPAAPFGSNSNVTSPPRLTTGVDFGFGAAAAPISSLSNSPIDRIELALYDDKNLSHRYEYSALLDEYQVTPFYISHLKAEDLGSAFHAYTVLTILQNYPNSPFWSQDTDNWESLTTRTTDILADLMRCISNKIFPDGVSLEKILAKLTEFNLLGNQTCTKQDTEKVIYFLNHAKTYIPAILEKTGENPNQINSAFTRILLPNAASRFSTGKFKIRLLINETLSFNPFVTPQTFHANATSATTSSNPSASSNSSASEEPTLSSSGSSEDIIPDYDSTDPIYGARNSY